MSRQQEMERPLAAPWAGAAAGQWSPPPRQLPTGQPPPPTATRADWRPFLVAAGVAALVLVALTVALGTGVLSTAARRTLSDVALIPLAGFLAAAAARAARRSAAPACRLAWGLLAAAGVCWMLGESAWYESRYVYRTANDPSWADLFYLAGLLPAAGALLAFARRIPHREQARDLLDALVVAGSVVFVSKALALSVIFPAAGEAEPLARAVYVAYPLADMVLATLAIVVLLRVQRAGRASMSLVAVGILAFALTDTWYSYRGALGDYEPGSVWDVGWAAGYLLLGLAALAPDAAQVQASRPVRDEPVAPRTLTVYVPVVVAVVVAAVRPQPPDDRVLVVSGLVVVVLFGLRQVLLAQENAYLGRRLRRRLTELEHRSTDLRLFAAQTERVLDSVVDGVLEVGPDRRIRFANPAAVRLLDRSPAALPDTDESDLFPDADILARGGCSAIADALRTGRQAAKVDATFRRPDGTTFPVEMTVGPVLNRGEVLAVVVVFRDASDRPA